MLRPQLRVRWPSPPSSVSPPTPVVETTSRGDETKDVRRMVDVTPCAAALNGRESRRGIDTNSLHRMKVEHDTTVHGGEACDVVAPATNRKLSAALSRELDRGHDVRDVHRASDQRGMSIDRCVVGRAELVVALVISADQVASEPRLERRRIELHRCSSHAAPLTSE
jgi:hypothetical protein